jgi:tricorn protease-like protein
MNSFYQTNNNLMWSTFVKKCIWLLIIAGSPAIYAQLDAGLFRFPDVSADHIVFTYANDLWLMPKEGGQLGKTEFAEGH